MRKHIVSVLGGNSAVSDEALTQAESLGRAIVDNGWLLCTGGRSGIMEAASIGARRSDSWTGHQIIGILPNENHGSGNQYLDVELPSGLGLARNALVVRFCDVCVALSGGAGTLSEIALAWQFERPVAVMSNSGGWSERLSGMALDHRQPPINGFEEVSQVIDWIKHQLDP
jgi:uncharacterized protein (TIGR00725 family)